MQKLFGKPGSFFYAQNYLSFFKKNQTKIIKVHSTFIYLPYLSDMVEYYQGHSKYLLAVDCVVFGYENGELKLLLYPRGFEPVKGKWSLMGGFVLPHESCDQAACRVLQQTTGLENIFLEQVAAFSDPNREEYSRVVSIAYYALIDINKHNNELAREQGTRWCPLSSLPQLIFDHDRMVREALLSLQQKAGYSLVGIELLPEKFTLLQLRKLYEAIYQRKFDPGNFRKKILSLDLLEKLGEKNQTESRKGAYYFRIKGAVKDAGTERIVKF
jgi:8-oxo-dGTP diphosphatase